MEELIIKYDANDGVAHLHHLERLMQTSIEAIKTTPLKAAEDIEGFYDTLGDPEFSEEERHQRVLETYSSEMMRSDVLQRLQYHNSLTTAFAAFEFTLSQMAEHVLKNNGENWKLRDVSGSKLEKCQKVFKNVLKLDLNRLEGWAKINDYAFLRHTVMHGGGLVNRNHDDAKKAEKIDHVKLIPFGSGEHFSQINLPYFFLNYAFKVLRDFLLDVEKEIEGRLPA